MTATLTTPRLAPPAQGVIHVWRVVLDADTAPDVSCLSASERERLALRTGHAAGRFALAHVALRRIAAAYQGCLPQEAQLVARYGEPPRAASGLELSLAHCDDLALIAVASSPVGIDVEAIAAAEADGDELADLAHATLTHAELELFGRTTPGERQTLWLRLWVRKEALLKARGAGLGDIPLFELDARASRGAGRAIAALGLGPAHVGAAALAARTVRIEWKELDNEC